MVLKRFQFPILLSLFFSSVAAFPREITRIHIKGWLLGQKEELIVEKKNSHYYVQKKMVSDAAVRALLEAINSRIVEKLDPDNLGLTQTWLNKNARPALGDYLKHERKSLKTLSSEQKQHFLTSFTDLQIMKKVVDDYYNARFWGDGVTSVEIVVQTDEEKVIEITSRSAKEFMLPWHISSVGPGEYFTWDRKFSRVIAQLMPRNFLNRERIAGLCFRQALSGMMMENIPFCAHPQVGEINLTPADFGPAPIAPCY